MGEKIQQDRGDKVTTTETFDIGTAAKMAGIHPQLLRAWQTRYGWPKPFRHQNGHRFFTRAQVEQLRRVAELRSQPKPYDIRELIEDGELRLPDVVKQPSEKDKIIADLRGQVAMLRELMNKPVAEYWTEEGKTAREIVLDRCTGGEHIYNELVTLRDAIEHWRGKVVAGTRPAMQFLEDCGALNYLRENGRLAPGDSLEVVLKWFWYQVKIDERRLADERNSARSEVQDLAIRQGELVRRLDLALRANDGLMSRELPELTKRAQRAEKRLARFLEKYESTHNERKA
jgi:DNA-binding transcriptional MerR regulator